MSGAGWRSWAVGEVATSSHVQQYLQDQVIPTFASASARDAAITSPAEGMFADCKDVDITYRYSGSAWVPVFYGGAWTSYTPAWTSSGTAPGLGNGTLVGSYAQFGKVIHFRLVFTAGSTTTYGTGNYNFSIPLTANTTVTATANCRVLDASATSAYFGHGTVFSTTVIPQTGTTGSPAVLSTVTNTSPMTFATSDEVRIWGTYEAS